MNYIWVCQKMYAHDMQFWYLILSYWTEGSGFLSSTYQRETKQGNFYITRKTNFSCMQKKNRILIGSNTKFDISYSWSFHYKERPRWKKLFIYKCSVQNSKLFPIGPKATMLTHFVVLLASASFWRRADDLMLISNTA